MNYRHIYHAGNFADVLKHAVLALVVDYLKSKPKPFRVIDTHAGIGEYDLTSVEATKTEEWRAGIGRLLSIELPTEIREMLSPYFSTLEISNPQETIQRYPGSPLLVSRLLRSIDTLIVNELHPADFETLKSIFARNRQVKVLNLDGWAVMKATLPPKERRGVVLIDPPFEEPGELDRMLQAISEAMVRFETGIVLLWYPIKDRQVTARFIEQVQNLGLPKVLSTELYLRTPRDPDRLNGSGLVIVNPPFGLAAKLQKLTPFLARALGEGPSAAGSVQWLGKVEQM